MKTKPGNRVKATWAGEALEGILVPSEDPEHIVLKLDNGYNIGLKKNKAKLEKIKDAPKKKSSGRKRERKAGDSKKPSITILHTGGTIASKVDYRTGGVTGQFDPEEILELFPELGELGQFDSRLIRNIMSENIRFDHYNLLAREIEKEVKKGRDGIILTMGTDTLHIMSAALCFALESLPVPVVIVGSQRSSDRPSSDSYLNLISAATFIASAEYAGVFVCMHENSNDGRCMVMHGAKVRKMHTSRRDAFRPINTTPVAVVDAAKKSIEKIIPPQAPDGEFSVKAFDPRLKVGHVKTHTHMYAEELKPYENFDGLILEFFALGQAPIIAQDEFMRENEKIAKEIKKLAGKIPVAVASQCIYGRVDMNVYSEGRELKKLGVIGDYHDMTPETAFVKLAWLLSNHRGEVKELFSKNLRGEITERSAKNTFLI